MNCGEEIPQLLGTRRILYCNERCKDKYYDSTTQTEREKIREILATYKPPSIYKKQYICNFCKKKFEEYTRNHRIYCSKECVDNARRHGSAIPRGRYPGEKERKRAIHLYQTEGLTAYTIAQQMKLNNGIVASWIKSHKKKLQKPDSSRWLTESHFRFVSTNNAKEWHKILQDEMKSSEFEYTNIIKSGVKVHLICETINAAHKGVDYFVTIASEKLGLDPFDGGYYAFCGNRRTKMRFIRWDGSGFQLTCRRKEEGLYIWPPKRLGDV